MKTRTFRLLEMMHDNEVGCWICLDDMRPEGLTWRDIEDLNRYVCIKGDNDKYRYDVREVCNAYETYSFIRSQNNTSRWVVAAVIITTLINIILPFMR